MPTELAKDFSAKSSVIEAAAIDSTRPFSAARPDPNLSPGASAGKRPEALLLGRATQEGRRNWVTTIFMTAFHVGAVAALFMFTWHALLAAIVLWVMAINMGIGMGYHRLLTHRGYRTPKWVEYLLAICGTLALQGGPIFWVATHRLHHQLSDRPGDPHSPHDGGWWAHAGWILSGDALHHETALMSRYAPDLAKDRFLVLLNKYHYVPLVAAGLALLLWGGWPCLMWGIFLRVTLGLHSTWLVNSATHMWGSKRFPTRDDSRNNWWVALLTGGEGWHNNHHAHPVSARHGLAWYELDLNYCGIWLLEKLGLAKNIHVAGLDGRERRASGLARTREVGEAILSSVSSASSAFVAGAERQAGLSAAGPMDQ